MTLTIPAPAKKFQYALHSLLLLFTIFWIWGNASHNLLLTMTGVAAYGTFLAFIAKAGKNRSIDFEFELGPENADIVRLTFQPSVGAGFIYINGQYLILDGQIAQWIPGKHPNYTFEVGSKEKYQVSIQSHGFRFLSWARKLTANVLVNNKELSSSEVSVKA